MIKNNLTVETTAQALGMSRRMSAYYRYGAKPILKHMWLACIGYEQLQKQHTT